jgi:hypothetical protein
MGKQVYPAEASERRVDRPDRLLDGLFERLADSHDLSDRLHRRRERSRDPRELLEIPPRDLDDEVVERRLEARTRVLGDRVLDLVERDVETELGRRVRERVSGRLGSERRRTRKTGVDLDDAVLLRVRVERILDVALSDNAEVADDVDGGRPEHVVVRVGQSLRRRNDDRVSSVDTERVKVLVTHEQASVVRNR